MSQKLRVRLLSVHASIPTASYRSPLAYDLYSAERVWIWPGSQKLIGTGISISFDPVSFHPDLPPFLVGGLINDRSSVPRDRKLGVRGGVIDPDYTGEIHVLLENYGAWPRRVDRGSKIAQIVPTLCLTGIVEVVACTGTDVTDEREMQRLYKNYRCDPTPVEERGSAGFGSSGS